MEIVKNAIRVGNSAGVLLPRKWLNSQVKVVLEPLNIEKDVLEILIEENILKDISGVYLIGSYARNEQTIESDIDILAITSNLNKKIKIRRYEIMMISLDVLNKQIEKNAIPIIPMLREAKPLVNSELIRKFRDSRLTKKNLRFHIETTKSAMKIVEKEIEIAGETDKKVSDASAYSLILRLRTLYIIECIRKDCMWKKRDFLKLIKNISGSETAYERYIQAKNKNTLDYKLPLKEAEKLMTHIIEKIAELEKWLEERKD